MDAVPATEVARMRPPRRAPLIDVDPELAAFAGAAGDGLEVLLHDVRPGPLPLLGGVEDGLGLLVVDGLLAQQTRLGEHCALLLSWEADLLLPAEGVAPWLGDVAEASVSWEALTPAVVAEVGPGIPGAAEVAPRLLSALARRAALVQARASVHQAISQLPRVSDRLLAALLLVAEERGQATVDGLVVLLPLTHERLGALIGARRPTVSLAVAQLRRRELLHRREDGAWVIAHGAGHALEAALGSDGVVPGGIQHVARGKRLRTGTVPALKVSRDGLGPELSGA
jgi:CRP/FNR family transcriptional regulator, cyclic AMP receptor protein